MEPFTTVTGTTAPLDRANVDTDQIMPKEFLKRIAHLAKAVHSGTADDTPKALDTPGKRALYNNLSPGRGPTGDNVAQEPTPAYRDGTVDRGLDLALRIDETVRRFRQDSWRDNNGPKERFIKAALLPLLGDSQAEVERVFLIIKAQAEY